jgi:hypothetical protein
VKAAHVIIPVCTVTGIFLSSGENPKGAAVKLTSNDSINGIISFREPGPPLGLYTEVELVDLILVKQK